MGGAVRGDQAAHAGGGRPAGRLSVRRAVLRRVRARAAARARVVALLLAVLVAVAAAFCAPGGSPGARAAQPAPDAPPSRPTGAQRLDVGRFTAVAYPRDLPLARALLAAAARTDTFPGLPRPRARVLVGVAPDAVTFRRWAGAGAPEWGAALAFPHQSRIVMQGRAAPSDAGDPIAVFRHELAHLALHEALGDLPPRWFDEGYASYAAGEFGRDDVLAANLALLTRGVPHLDDLDAYFAGGAGSAQEGYAFAYRAVADLAALDPQRGLALFFAHWRETGRFDLAVRQAYGVTADAFEDRWRRGTRRRYGVLALAANVSLVGAAALVVILPLWSQRRRRDRERLAAMRAADEATDRAAAEREAGERALAALLGELPAPDGR
jgi:hypothetical protein